MKAAIRAGLVALAAMLAAGTATSAVTPPSIVEAGGSVYPERSYILTLPAARSLARSEVRITENGSSVSGVSLARQGTVNSRSAVVLAIDESLTMKGKPLENAFAAARAFAARANPDEEIAVVTFNGSVHVLQGFTSSAKTIDKALSQTPDVVYGTKNYDALQQALGLITGANFSSGSVIILTDGQSVGNVAKPEAVLRALSNAHIRVFPVGLASPAFKPAPLQHMAAVTGGSFVEANGPSALRPILLTLARRLSSEYLVTYQSRANPGTAVAVRVSVAGFAGAATSEYTTPALHVVAAGPYRPSTYDRAIQSNYAVAAIAILCAGLLGFAVVHVARAGADPLVDRVGDFVSVQQGTRRDPSAPRESLIKRPAILDRWRGDESSWYPRLVGALELAELEIGPYQLILLTGLVTLLFALLLYSLNPIVGLVALIAVPFGVRSLILRRIAKKRNAFAEQLPDNLEVLASSLRAGHSLVGALAVVAEDASEPSKSEFQRVVAEEQFGAQLEEALQVAVKRMANTDLDQVALVARLQRDLGSNSAEVLDRVVETVRARMEIRRLVKTLTAQGRMSRAVLTALPIGVGLLLLITSRSYMSPFIHRTAGQVLIGMAVAMIALGSWVIGKIIDIKVF